MARSSINLPMELKEQFDNLKKERNLGTIENTMRYLLSLVPPPPKKKGRPAVQLSEADIATIRELRKQGNGYIKISKQFRIGVQTVRDILKDS